MPERRVVDATELVAVGSTHGQHEVDRRTQEAHGLDLADAPCARRQRHDVAIGILTGHLGADGAGQLQHLRAVVRSRLGDFWLRADEDVEQVGQPAGRSQPHRVGTEFGILVHANLQHARFGVLARHDGEQLEPRITQQQVLDVDEPFATDSPLDLGTALRARRHHRRHARRQHRTDSDDDRDRREQQQPVHASTPAMTAPSRTRSIGRSPGAMSFFSGSIPSWANTVAARSAGLTASRSGSAPLELVSPCT